MKKGMDNQRITSVRFCDQVEDASLKFAVIISKSNDKWVYCRHRARDTYEIPGGHREAGETILETARRELYEETGAVRYALVPVCAYCVVQTGPDDCETSEDIWGMLYYAEITEFEQELHNEIEKIEFFESPPAALTYPQIQPHLLREAQRRGFC